MAAEFPLTWPDHIQRSSSREAGRFKTSLASALNNVRGSIKMFGSDSGRPVSGLIISTNYTLSNPKPRDPGVAVWFVWDGIQVCIPVDRYSTIEANLQAIYHVVEARRTELRHGTLALVRATFKGFQALPAPGAPRPWRDVLDFMPNDTPQITRDVIEARYRRLASIRHPDKPGGSHDAMSELNRAKEEALKEIGE